MASIAWRDFKEHYRFIGYKCKSCGFISFPDKRTVCPSCGRAPEEFVEVKLSPRGKIMAYTVQYIPSELGAPPHIFATIDLEGGGRISGIITDCKPGEVKIGMDVEYDFRRMVTVNDVNIYTHKFKILKR